ncbi:MAG: homoprotocatechuate degradation operon regulator HpaR, partial [Alphaproteobacteria bacterium]
MREFARSLPMALLKARESVMSRFRPLLRAHDLTEQQWRVLRAGVGAGGPEVTALARRSFILMPSLSRILQNLEARALIKRRPAKKDQRRALISVTKAGRTLVARIAPYSERHYAEIERIFGPEKLE